MRRQEQNRQRKDQERRGGSEEPAMLIAAIALPTAFTTGAVVFGLALLAVRLINAGMFIASSSRDEAELASAIRRLAPGPLIGPVDRPRLTLDAYSYLHLHLPLVAGIVSLPWGHGFRCNTSTNRWPPSPLPEGWHCSTPPRWPTDGVTTIRSQSALILAAAFMASPYRELLWIAAAAVAFGSPLLAGTNGLRVVPSYFIERHGSVIIIALGETIIAWEQAHPTCGGPVVVCGVLITATLWWTYFGLTAGAEERMRRTPAVPSSRITNCASFQTGDETRRVQRIAYRTLQLAGAPLGDEAVARQRTAWEEAAAFQPLRELIERALVTYDWGESFIVTNAVIKPRIDRLVNQDIAGALATANGDPILTSIHFSLDEDAHWHRGAD